MLIPTSAVRIDIMFFQNRNKNHSYDFGEPDNRFLVKGITEPVDN